MSSGRFITVTYTRGNGDTHPIRVQPETVTAWNPASSAEPESDIPFRVSGGNRSQGPRARLVRLTFGDSPPAGYAEFSSITLPVFSPVAFGALTRGQVVQYLGTSATIQGKSAAVPPD